MISEKREAAGGLLLGTAPEGKREGRAEVTRGYWKHIFGAAAEGAKSIGGSGEP